MDILRLGLGISKRHVCQKWALWMEQRRSSSDIGMPQEVEVSPLGKKKEWSR